MSVLPPEPPTHLLSHIGAALVYLAHARLLSALHTPCEAGPHLARVYHELAAAWEDLCGAPLPDGSTMNDAFGDSSSAET